MKGISKYLPLVLSFAALDAMAAANRLSENDRKFVEKLSQANAAEVELGTYAHAHGQSDKVKDFGQRMVDDHSKLEKQLQEWAQTNGVELAQGPSKAESREAKNLEKLSGQKFDEAYVRNMLADHHKDVREVQMKAKHADDPQVKALASQTLPVLEEHLQVAESLATEMGISKAGHHHAGKPKAR